MYNSWIISHNSCAAQSVLHSWRYKFETTDVVIAADRGGISPRASLLTQSVWHSEGSTGKFDGRRQERLPVVLPVRLCLAPNVLTGTSGGGRETPSKMTRDLDGIVLSDTDAGESSSTPTMSRASRISLWEPLTQGAAANRVPRGATYSENLASVVRQMPKDLCLL